MPSDERLAKKKVYLDRLISLVEEYPKVLIVHADHVGSKQMANIRIALRGKAIVLMGKNTMMRTALRRSVEQIPALEKLIPCVKLNIGFIFCINDPSEVRKIVLENRVPAPAKQGVLAPIDVEIPAGPTGMDPGSTSFFQALGISTKIVKGQIEIQNDVHIIKHGEKVSASASALLQKLGIKPFSYGLAVQTVYDDGSVYDASILDVTDEDIFAKFALGTSYVAAMSRQIGIPTAASTSHCLLEGFKFATAMVLESDYTFPEMENIKKMVENPDAFAAAASATPAAGGGKAAVAAAAAEESEEEDEGDLGFSLFD